MNLILGLDIGTTKTAAVLFDTDTLCCAACTGIVHHADEGSGRQSPAYLIVSGRGTGFRSAAGQVRIFRRGRLRRCHDFSARLMIFVYGRLSKGDRDQDCTARTVG